MKFKVGFTIGSETLFAMIAKMLPIENVSVEEIVESKTPLAQRAIALHQKKFPTQPKKQIHRRASPGPSLTRGINMVIVNELESGPKRATELQPKAKAAGFSNNSVNSRLEALRNHGIVERIGDGRWRLKKNAELDPVQGAALNFADGKTGVGYFMEMGLGKTLLTLAEFSLAVRKREATRLVVIAPNSFKPGWVEEIFKHGTRRPAVHLCFRRESQRCLVRNQVRRSAGPGHQLRSRPDARRAPQGHGLDADQADDAGDRRVYPDQDARQ